MFKDLDEVDRKIIDLLQQNSRMSNAEIARRVHLSRVAVRERIQQLSDSQVIQEFGVVINANALGYNVSAFFDIEVLPDKLINAAKELAKQQEVVVVYQMTGPSSLHVHAFLKDSQHMAVFMKENIFSIPGVQKVNSNLLLQRFKSVLNIR
jgi:DNA-binding Lrp family transcriptional regulator